MTKTRVLEIFGEPIDVGGQESYVVNTVERMNKDNLMVDVLTPYRCKSKSHRERIEGWGGVVYALGLPFHPGHSREYVAAPLRGFLKTHAYDVVHVHSGSTSFLAIASRAAKAYGVSKVIVHSHCASARMGPKQHLIRAVSSLRMRGAVDAYCACSADAGKSKFISSVQRDLILMGNGIDTKAFSYSARNRQIIRNEGEVGEDILVVGNVGRIGHQKNQIFALKVFACLHEVWNQTALWLVGDGQDRIALEAEAERLGLRQCVRFWGARQDVPALLSGMDVYLFPSIMEGFPIALLEAECSGLPCVVSSAVTREVDCVKGFVVYEDLSHGSEVWAKRIIECAGKRSCDAPHQILCQGYDIATTACQLRDLYTGAA